MNFRMKPFLMGSSCMRDLGSRGLGGGISIALSLLLFALASSTSISLYSGFSASSPSCEINLTFPYLIHRGDSCLFAVSGDSLGLVLCGSRRVLCKEEFLIV